VSGVQTFELQAALAWPCDACFLRAADGLTAQWRGGLYRITGRRVATLARAFSGEPQTDQEPLTSWIELVRGLEQRAAERSVSDRMPRTAALCRAPTTPHALSDDPMVVTCLGPGASRNVAAALSRFAPELAVVTAGYAWQESLPGLVSRGAPSAQFNAATRQRTRPEGPLLCVLSPVIVGEVADWVAAESPRMGRVVWSILWPEGLYLVESDTPSHSAMTSAVARAEANSDDLAIGLSMMRANASGSFVPATAAGPTDEQLKTLLALVEDEQPSAGATVRIVDSGAFELLAASGRAAAPTHAAGAPLQGVSGVEPQGVDRLADPRLGVLTFDYAYGTLETTGGPIHVWRARFGDPRHRLGEHDLLDPGMDAFAADSDPSVARLKAQMEALERFAGMHWPAAGAIIARQVDLPKALGMEEVASYSQAQYETLGFGLRRFDRNQRCWWLPATSLLDGCAIWVLGDLVIWPPPVRPGYAQASSSGTAAHFSWERACVNAMYELVERDALLLAWLKRVACPPLPRSSLPHELVTWTEALARDGYQVHILDATTDTGIPTVMTLAEATLPGVPVLQANGAAGPSLVLAARKALLELLMMIVYRRSLGTQSSANTAVERYHEPRDHARLYFGPASRDRWTFLLANDAPTTRPLELGIPTEPAAALRELASRLGTLGPLVAVDRTLPVMAESGVRVVSVVAAGLQPLHFGADHCRVRSARLAATAFPAEWSRAGPTDSHGLNAYPHPFA